MISIKFLIGNKCSFLWYCYSFKSYISWFARSFQGETHLACKVGVSVTICIQAMTVEPEVTFSTRDLFEIKSKLHFTLHQIYNFHIRVKIDFRSITNILWMTNLILKTWMHSTNMDAQYCFTTAILIKI